MVRGNGDGDVSLAFVTFAIVDAESGATLVRNRADESLLFPTTAIAKSSGIVTIRYKTPPINFPSGANVKPGDGLYYLHWGQDKNQAVGDWFRVWFTFKNDCE